MGKHCSKTLLGGTVQSSFTTIIQNHEIPMKVSLKYYEFRDPYHESCVMVLSWDIPVLVIPMKYT